MIARIQIPKGWRRLRKTERVLPKDRILSHYEWRAADTFFLHHKLTAADYNIAIRRVKRKRAKAAEWVEVSFEHWMQAPSSGLHRFRFSDKMGGRMMNLKEWRMNPIRALETRFWLRRGAR